MPVAAVSAGRYRSLRRLLFPLDLWYSSFDDRPSRLFEGIEHSRLSLLLGPCTPTPRRFSTRYDKWTRAERTRPLDTRSYVEAVPGLVDDSQPRLSSPLEIDILRKPAGQGITLAAFLTRAVPSRVYYSRKVGSFLQVLDFVPRVCDGWGKDRFPSDF